jgi:hypothetical protein
MTYKDSKHDFSTVRLGLAKYGFYLSRFVRNSQRVRYPIILSDAGTPVLNLVAVSQPNKQGS